jgi:hypothetical protein
MAFDSEKEDDIIVGNEDIRICSFRKYADEDVTYIDKEGNEHVTSVIQVEKEFYYLCFETISKLEYYHNDELSDFCNIDFDSYKKILIKNNGKYYNEMDCHIFTNTGDAKAVLDELTPYIVMNKLYANNKKCNIEKFMEADITEDDDYWEGYSHHYSDGSDVDNIN